MKEALRLVVALAKQFEGFSGAPYLCPAGVPTIGYGMTHHLDGRAVQMTDEPVSEAEAELVLIKALSQQYMPAALTASPGLLDYPEQLAAITDFCFNLGPARYRASTLRKRIDEKDWEGAAVEIMRWNRCGGKVLRGLTSRRAAERALLLTGV